MRLDTAQLEELRLLTNCDMDAKTPLALVLLGQPSLRQRLRLGTSAALDQRVGLRYAIPPMTAAETADYIAHHLRLRPLFPTTPSNASTGPPADCPEQ